jgi:ferric-dicitrate binding protein FerR (iron transport regulator)
MQEELIYLIIKRLTNTIDSEESALLQQWIENSPENHRIFDEVSDIWLASAAHRDNDFDSSEALRKVKLRLEKVNPQTEPKKKLLHAGVFLKVAAFALILISVSIFSYYAGISKNKPKEDFTFIEAPLGSRTRVSLPDGTKVWLNGGSNLKFANTFNKSNRSVTITGEGYFDVTHNKNLPFVVNTREIRIKVLGTAFNIKAYPDEGLVETTLERGSLAIEKVTSGGPVQQTVLEPNQRATFVKNEGKVYLSDIDKKATGEKPEEYREPVKEQLLISKKIDTHVFTSWKDDKLVFRNEPFESLTIKLERWYGMSIVIEDEEIKKYHFNGTFEKETIHDVLNIIHFTLPINYTVNHDQIFIRLDKTAWRRQQQ